jgi:hypothetical protein
MADSAGTMDSDGGEAVERDKKKSHQHQLSGTKATRDFGMVEEGTKRDRTV